METHEFIKEYDPAALGFIFRRRVVGETSAELIGVMADELRQVATANGREILDRGFLTIPIRMRIYIRGIDRGILELSCRLPLAASDETLAERQDELEDAVRMLGFDIVGE